MIRDHNARFNPRGVKRGAEEDRNQADATEPEKKRLCIETCKALTDEALMEDKSLGNTSSLKNMGLNKLYHIDCHFMFNIRR